MPVAGGGSGTPPPLLYGTATGIASAQPGIYWNEADKWVIPIGGSVAVKAWKNDNEPAPSSWSKTGPISVSGGGASATVTGTAASEEEYDAVVTSTCNESGKSDTEAFTVVGVERLEYWKEGEWSAMPEVMYVALGETRQFRAVKKPEEAPAVDPGFDTRGLVM